MSNFKANPGVLKFPDNGRTLISTPPHWGVPSNPGPTQIQPRRICPSCASDSGPSMNTAQEYSKCVATLSGEESQGQTPDVNYFDPCQDPVSLLVQDVSPVAPHESVEVGQDLETPCTSCTQKCHVLGSWTLMPGSTRPQPNPGSMSFEFFFPAYVEHCKKEGRYDTSCV
ncbi:hypothetical protein BGW80DRAFT_1377461 [Lactifluus volemus]|nr:hypothetical protein BGW80DRAFT_1377461 [Lactifluus volemus]